MALFHEGEQDNPAQGEQRKQRREHVELAADVTPLRTNETATQEHVSCHEHKAVVNITHNALLVKISRPRDVNNGRQ